jgi:hypothetical protein
MERVESVGHEKDGDGGGEKRSVVLIHQAGNFCQTAHSKMRKAKHQEWCVASPIMCPIPHLSVCLLLYILDDLSSKAARNSLIR